MSFFLSKLVRQIDPSSFEAGPSIGECQKNHYAQFVDLNGDNVADMLCGREGTFPNAIYDLSAGTATLMNPQVGLNAGSTLDTVIADFDGDLENEVFVVRGASFPNDAKSITPNRAEAFLDSASGQGNAGFTFNSNSPVSFVVYGRNTNEVPVVVNVGETKTIFAGGINNVANLVVQSTPTGEWDVVLDSSSWAAAYIVLESVGAMSDFVATGLRVQDLPMVPTYLNRSGDVWANEAVAAGFVHEELCYSVTAGDYDNDGDIDIALACRGAVENLPNRIYENDGSGVFTRVADGAGAQGVVGIGLESKTGTSESIITGDYNNDGYLDLFLTNGSNDMPVRQGGPHQVFENAGGQNNWLLLKLRGDQSNPNGLGARVTSTAGGLTQVREQNGGYHRWSQGDQRIHFGLGDNTSTDITIVWPSGITEVLNNVGANTIYVANEDAGLTPVTPGPVQKFPLPDANGFCGEPIYIAEIDRGVFLYRENCAANTWTIKTVGGQSGGGFVGRLVTTDGGVFSNVQPINLESEDTVADGSDLIDFDLHVANSGVDGFSFELNGGGACVALDAPTDVRVMVGERHVPIPNSGFDIVSHEACDVATLPVISVSPQSFDEDVGSALVQITLNEVATKPVSFGVRTTTGGSATPGQDYYGLPSINKTIAAGQQSTSVEITVLADSEVESDETINLGFLNISGANLGAVEPVTLVDVPVADEPTISVAAQRFSESVGTAKLKVSLDQAPGAGESVSAKVFTTTVNSTATPGQDYYGIGATLLNFGANDVEREVDLTILSDTAIEGDETIGVKLVAVTGASKGVVSAATIEDDDTETIISVAAQSVAEAAGFIDVVIAIDKPAPPGAEISARFYVTSIGSTATPGLDYYGIGTTTVTFSGNVTSQTVRVPILADTEVEGDETIVTKLVSIVGAVAGDVLPITIEDDD